MHSAVLSSLFLRFFRFQTCVLMTRRAQSERHNKDKMHYSAIFYSVALFDDL